MTALALVGAAALWWACRYGESTNFLPSHHGAEWIVYPKPPEGAKQRPGVLMATFRRSFIFDVPRSGATIALYACKTGGLEVNEQTVTLPRSTERGWKKAMLLDVTKYLRAGTNLLAVTVSNTLGPPALWLRLDLGNRAERTDESWEVSLAGSTWQPACLARKLSDKTFGASALAGSERMSVSLRRIWLWLAGLAAGSLSLALPGGRVFRAASDSLSGRRPRGETPGPKKQDQANSTIRPGCSAPRYSSQKIVDVVERIPVFLLGVILMIRGIMFFQDAPLLPRNMGFDAVAHEEYVQFIREKHALPLAKDGWEMFQPPLYYVIGALVTGMDGGTIGSEHATFLLRTINAAVGLIHCWLVLLCLQRLFRNNIEAQAVGLVIAAFLPPHLYLSQFVTNEALAGLFATASFYFLLCCLDSDKISHYAGLGVFLGLAMLTKFSCLLIVIVICLGLMWHLLFKKPVEMLSTASASAHPEKSGGAVETVLSRLRLAWRGPVIAIACPVLVCGWHYVRVWVSTGALLVGNWEPNSPFAWWQDPGFRVAPYYFTFGQSLASPLFSSFHSFADGIYSTLWGDGLGSGAARLAFRPPWNYDWMNAGYLLALPLCAILLLGLVVAFASWVRSRSALLLVMLGSLGLFAAGILFMTLRVPSYAQVKAFYAFPALLPAIFVFATGWNWLTARKPIVRYVIRASLLMWLACVLMAFWIRRENPETSLVQGMYLAEIGRDTEAMEQLSLALQKDVTAWRSGRRSLGPQAQAETLFNLGTVLDRQGMPGEAIHKYRLSLAAKPDFDGALNNLAWLLATCPDNALRDGKAAVTLAQRACRLTDDRVTVYIGTLAAAYAEAGNFPEAVSTAEKTIRLAQLRSEGALAKRNGELLELYRVRKPYREKAG